MADIITLKAEPRTIIGKDVKKLRAQNIIPVVVYGPSVAESVQFQIEGDALRQALRQAGATNLIALDMGSGGLNVLVREVQRGILRNELLHVDFYAVDMAAKTTADVPVTLVGESEMIVQGLAMLITRSNTVTVECLPANIPEAIELDISGLAEIGDYLTVADLKVPEDVTILADPEETLVQTDHPTRLEEEEEEEEEEFVGEGEAGEVEVISRGKEEEEEID